MMKANIETNKIIDKMSADINELVRLESISKLENNISNQEKFTKIALGIHHEYREAQKVYQETRSEPFSEKAIEAEGYLRALTTAKNIIDDDTYEKLGIEI